MKKSLTFIMFLFSLVAFAKPTDEEVTLICAGTAQTESAALDMALRSAIEQTAGAFVSSNTSVINNRLMKDETVVISKGNIKKYDKLSTTHLKNGDVCVTVKATVSVGKVIDFAVKNGATVTFDGNAYAMNAKLLELRQANTKVALSHLSEQIKEMCTRAYDWEVSLEQPQKTIIYDWGRPLKRNVYSNKLYFDYDWMYKQSPTSIDCYAIEMNIEVKANSVTSEIYNIISSTLSALSLNVDEISQYQNLIGIAPAYTCIMEMFGDEIYYALPCAEGDIEKCLSGIAKSLIDAFFSYKIVENASNRSYVWESEFFKAPWSSLYCTFKKVGTYAHEFDIRDSDMFLMQSQDKTVYIQNARDYSINEYTGLVESSGAKIADNRPVDRKSFIRLIYTDIKLKSGFERGPVLILPKFNKVINMTAPILYTYSVTLHLPINEMSSFKGYTIERTF